MGIDPAQLAFGLQTLSSEVANPDPTFTTLTVTGDTLLGDATLGGASYIDTLFGGDATISGDTTLGDATLSGSAYVGDVLSVEGDSTLSGSAFLPGLPTADPVSADELWNDSNSAAISAGA